MLYMLREPVSQDKLVVDGMVVDDVSLSNKPLICPWVLSGRPWCLQSETEGLSPVQVPKPFDLRVSRDRIGTNSRTSATQIVSVTYLVIIENKHGTQAREGQPKRCSFIFLYPPLG